MTYRTTLTASALALFAVSLNASAVEPVAAAAAEPATTEAAPAEKANCLQETGSRISTSADRPCISAPGQVVTRDQIERTGAATTAEALRKASPAVH